MKVWGIRSMGHDVFRAVAHNGTEDGKWHIVYRHSRELEGVRLIGVYGSDAGGATDLTSTFHPPSLRQLVKAVEAAHARRRKTE